MTEIDTYSHGRDRFALDVLRDQFAPDASDLDLQHFAYACGRLKLDPYAEQICLIGRNQKVRDDRGRETWRLIFRPQITVAGRRAIAGRTGRLAGIEGPQWCPPRRYGSDGERLPLEWLDVWDDDDNYPYAARCLVWPTGWDHPVNGTVKWSEFAVTLGSGDQTKLSPFWKRSPAHMLGKVAESLALRRAFPEVETAVAYLDQAADREPDDANLITEAEAGTPPVSAALSPSIGPAADPERVPDYVYDNLPEAGGVGVAHAYRYDPKDNKQ